MLPLPLWPLAEHAVFGQNWFDASIGSRCSCCISTSCRWSLVFSSLLSPFHQLVGLYQILRDLEQKRIPLTPYAFARRLGIDVRGLYQYAEICDRLSAHNRRHTVPLQEMIE